MVYRTTLSPIVSLRREMDRLFEDAVGSSRASASWAPAADVRETKDAWVFELDLPGVNPQAVEVTADQKVLTIRGEKPRARSDSEEQRWLSVERVSGSFERAFRLPSSLREEAIEAVFQNGLLTVTVPKAEVKTARRIEIKT